MYVFTRTNGTWTQQAYIKASNAQAGDGFGGHVALSGDTLAVTASGEDSCATGINGNQLDNSCIAGAGAVYVFTRTNGEWSQQAYLKAAHTLLDNLTNGFGRSSLALEGETLAVSAVADTSCAIGINGDPSDTNCGPAGAVYVFSRTNGVWTQQAYIKPTVLFPTVAYDFGSSVALSGDTLAVGSQNISCPSNIGGGCLALPGSAYVFRRSNGAWTQEALIQAGENTSGFGRTMALSSDTLAVTAPGIFSDAGTVYVFTRSGGTWSQQAFVTGSNTESGDSFGSSIAILGDTLAVGAEREASCATGIDGSQADNSCRAAGAVYVFNRRAGVWNQQAYVKATNTDPRDGFGGLRDIEGFVFFPGSVALTSNGTLAVGAPGESSCASGINGNQMDNNCLDAGAVYVYALQ